MTRKAPTIHDPALAIDSMALDAQVMMLPYALGVFTIGLGLFAWASAYADNRLGMAASLAIFAINLTAFYALTKAIKGQTLKPRRRLRLHMLGSLLWVGAIGQIGLVAQHAGPAREVLLLLGAGGAAAIAFFASPLLVTLLVAAPLAAACPLIGLYLAPETHGTADAAAGALALTMTLSLVMNRLFTRQFTLAVERDRLMEERAASMAEVERLAKSKSDLVSTLSHEIRNGLTGVSHVLAAAAGAGGRMAPSRDQLTAALTASRDLIGVLDATLDSESAEDGRLTVSPQPFDPARVAQDLALLARPAASARGLDLAVHVEPDLAGANLAAAVADPTRTRQIVSSLLSNAIKYTPRGRVELRLRRLGADRIRFEVADTGPGLSPDEIELAFLPFARVPRTCAGETGAGLGLSLARRIAGLMGAEVSAESAPGAGSCFWADLPFDPQIVLERESAPAEPASSPAALRVLLADDDQLASAMMRACLEQLGHQVLQAKSQARAGDLLRVCEVDLVLVGQGLDQGGALETVRGLKTSSPIVAVIGEAEEAAPLLAAGCRSVIRKPVSAQGLARLIADIRLPQAFPAQGYPAALRERA